VSRAGASLRAWLAADPEGRAATGLAVIAAIAVVAWPLSTVTFPPLTDLPMHAAHTGALRHFGDPSFHLADQFELQPIAVPYLSTYVVGAVLMVGCSASLAVRIATGLALLLVPLGVAVLARGMRKSPLIGLAAAPLVWGHLAHWGFINFVAAIGLHAMAMGLALRLVDRPRRWGVVGLAAVLVLLFFTHVFRFPFAVFGVGVAAAAAAWARTQGQGPLLARARLRAMARLVAPVVGALVPSLAFFLAFVLARPPSLAPGSSGLALTFDPARLAEVPGYLVGSYFDRAEPASAKLALALLAGVVAATMAVRLAWRSSADDEGDDEGEEAPAERRRLEEEDRRFRVAATAAVGIAVLTVTLGYLTLPIEIGDWWYVYPREATAVVVLALALLPDLPRVRGGRAIATVALAVGALLVARVPARHFAAFERTTSDFRRVIEPLPRAPKLLYLIFDHTGTSRTTSPFLHLPAWVQAEKGGWLSFHFAVFGASPLRFRTDAAAVVAPRLRDRWEWEPQRFDLERDAPFFDWFLVRSRTSPTSLFEGDPTLRLEVQEGTWWLYRRVPPEPAPP
jgi:hypothetical protein